MAQGTFLDRNLAAPICKVLSLLVLVTISGASPTLQAQTAGEGSIAGTVTDTSGAAIPNATVTATNTATNVSETRSTSGSGTYTIAPLQPGTYTVTVAAGGFKTLTQQNLDVVALGELGFNPVLTVGAATETVVVTTAPPVLDTTSATVGLVMENQTYANLPLLLSGSLQRDPTAFGTLTPGSQGGTRLPIIGGTGNYLGQLYIDGMPAETVSQQGDNRLVSESMSVDSVDQFQVVTSTPPAEYMGAGAENFTMKSGGLKLHGQVSDFVRNTAFDAWAFQAKAATTKNAAGQTVPAPKPIEHRNEFSASAGWKVPLTHDKLFFFVAYDRFHARAGASYSLMTVPTPLMQAGDFTELNGNAGTGGQSGTGSSNPAFLFDPTTTSCVGSVCTRTPFQGMKNGVPTYNVIPASYISPISKAEQQFLPPPSNPAVIVNNYLGGFPSGYDNHTIDWRVDYDLSAKQRISSVGAMGVVDYLNNFGAPIIAGPQGQATPYIGGDLAAIFPKDYQVEDTYVINSRMTNQFKYGFTRFYQDIKDETQGVTAWEESGFGVTNLPAGQAGQEFFGASFGTTPAFGSGLVPTGWRGSAGSVSTQLTTPNNFTLVDNVQWVKGRHALTFGMTYQWQEINNANPATFTGGLDLGYTAYDTANFAPGANTLTLGSAATSSAPAVPSGYSYASFLLGAVGGTPSLGLQYVSEEGGRYKPVSPYVMDSWKVTDKLTLDLGLRWDYLPPYREVKDRWTFLNPNLTNTATGAPGELQFAGNYGGAGVSCGCTTPVSTYWKNWGPRVGIAYSVDDKTVFRMGFAEVYTQAGGVGGRGGSFQGTGQTGFNTTATGPAEVTTGALAAPSFYLNNNTSAPAALQNTSLFGPGYAYPSAPVPSAASQILNTGFYLNAASKFVTASGVSYADPFISGRAPEMSFYNAGMERAITKDMTLAVNWVGDMSHFLNTGGNVRGYWDNQLNPIYLVALGGVTDTLNDTGSVSSSGSKPILISPATPQNVAKAQSVMPSINIPAFFQAAAAVSTTATITQGLVAFPQYSGVTDLWGANSENASYSSLQITLLQRTAHGLNFNINYTFSKNLADDSTFRSGFNIPSGALSNGLGGASTQAWHQDRIDRSLATVSTPESLHAFGVWQLPFGKGHIGDSSLLVRSLAGGWQLSGIYTYSSGTPVAVTSTVCSGTTFPGQGQCMPDLNVASPDYIAHNARINGSYGTGPHGTVASNLGVIQYVDVNAFSNAANVSTTSTAQYLLGDAPRTRPLNLWNPGSQNLDASLRRSFPLPREFGTFVFEADCTNVWNKVTMGGPSASWSPGSTSFGTISSASATPRDWQFAGHFNF
ncbi:MAG: TonB-dependent receptor [Acidobacteriaceae bacterium]|jgi:hypothetical protein